ncbi:MAG: MMPL family transporter [Firmicutes bacterium]|nr:MMPL family transporter [Bacillota bacterium]
MNNFSKFFARFVIRHRIVFILISLVLTILFAYQLRHLTLQTNLGDFAPQKHPYLAVQRQLTHIFGGLNQISIAIEVKEGDIFNYSTLSKVHRITKKLYLLDGINAGRVVSLSARKIKSVKATDEGFGAKRLMRYPPKSAEEMERLKETIVRNPMVYGPIVSKDFKSTLIQADFESDVSSRRIFRQVQQIIEEEKDSNNNIYIGGRPILEGWLDFYTPKMGKIFMGTLIVMILILYIAFRSKRGVLLPLASSLMATVWGLGILTLSGYKLGPTTILTPFLVMALGISHSVQFIKRYYEDELKHLSNKEASQETLQSLFVPACTSLVTDGLGFLSLLIVPLAMIRSMALATGVGVLSIFFTTVTFIPAVLSFLPSPKRKEVEREERFNLLNRILGKIASLSIHRFFRWAVVGIFLILGVVGTIGASRIVVGDNEPGSASLYRNSPYNVAETMISK